MIVLDILSGVFGDKYLEFLKLAFYDGDKEFGSIKVSNAYCLGIGKHR
ncbi:hypothetical protein ACFLR1_01225 [Bacteroidota bacterium]